MVPRVGFLGAMLCALALLCAGSASAAGGLGAGERPTIDRSPYLWATINVCDTAEHPDTVGVRASMPGSGRRREQMYMRFRVEFQSPIGNLWQDVGPTGDSGFHPVGSGRFRAREAGWNFRFGAAAGGTYTVRGRVTFEWRRGAALVRRLVKRTRSGFPGTLGADPPEHSAAACEIR